MTTMAGYSNAVLSGGNITIDYPVAPSNLIEGWFSITVSIDRAASTIYQVGLYLNDVILGAGFIAEIGTASSAAGPNQVSLDAFLTGLENGDELSMPSLVRHYQRTDQDLDLLIIYIKYNIVNQRKEIIMLFNKLFCQHSKLNKQQLLMLITEFNFIEEDDLCIGLELLVNSIHQQLSIMDLHFMYTINGKGYETAKTDFLNLL